MIPLYGFLEGDTIGLLVLGRPEDTALDLCHKLQAAAAVRVPPLRNPVVVYRGDPVPAYQTVATLGIGALERFDVVEGQLR